MNRVWRLLLILSVSMALQGQSLACSGSAIGSIGGVSAPPPGPVPMPHPTPTPTATPTDDSALRNAEVAAVVKDILGGADPGDLQIRTPPAFDRSFLPGVGGHLPGQAVEIGH